MQRGICTHHYFQEVAKAFPEAWGQKGYSTHSLIALRAFIQASREVLRRVFERGGDPRVSITELVAPWKTRIGSGRFETAGRWRERAAGGGKETTRLLARELMAALSSDGEARR